VRGSAAILALLGALAIAPRASAWCQMTSSRERPALGECIIAEPPDTWPLAWRRRCTSISLSTMGSSSLTTDEVRSVLRTSLDTWEAVDCGGQTTGLEVEVLEELNACSRASHYTNGANVHSLMFVSSGWVEERMHDPAAYAVTLVWHDTRSGEIWDADIEINEELRETSEYAICPATGCPVGQVDLQNVLTHELGHYFGLAHTPTDSLATMWAMAEPRETIKRDLAADDIAGLCAIYPPGSLPAECDGTPRGGLSLDCRRPSTCGCAAPGTGSGAPIGIAAVAVLAIAIRSRGRRARATLRPDRSGRSRPS
jgi:hypothetical protein